jgi:hypothetical protein
MRHTLANRRIMVISSVAALLLQATVMIVGIVFLALPISTEEDSVEYIRTADNVVAVHSFSIEQAPPFRPNGFRTPGPLLLNIPLRLLSFKNHIVAALISRFVLILGGFLCVAIAVQLGVDKFALLAGTLYILTPTMFYYSMLAYSTELPYSIACGLLELGTVLYLSKGNRGGIVLILLSSLYALWLRPAALFVLIAYIGSCILASFVTKQGLRRRVLTAAAICLFGTFVAYTSWCYRNYVAFNDFEYSTVSGENLLKWNARAMEPFLDSGGRQDLSDALKKYPIKLQRYSGADQFVLADQEAKEGLRIIFKYPIPFLESHFHGTLISTFIFRPAAVKSRVSAVILLSAVHCSYLVLGAVGLILLYRTLNVSQRTALLIIVFVGVVSLLSGGALYSPRFRIPLDIVLVVGVTYCIARTEAWMLTRGVSQTSLT